MKQDKIIVVNIYGPNIIAPKYIKEILIDLMELRKISNDDNRGH